MNKRIPFSEVLLGSIFLSREFSFSFVSDLQLIVFMSPWLNLYIPISEPPVMSCWLCVFNGLKSVIAYFKGISKSISTTKLYTISVIFLHLIVFPFILSQCLVILLATCNVNGYWFCRPLGNHLLIR